MNETRPAALTTTTLVLRADGLTRIGNAIVLDRVQRGGKPLGFALCVLL
jgi:hypothetical protein